MVVKHPHLDVILIAFNILNYEAWTKWHLKYWLDFFHQEGKMRCNESGIPGLYSSIISHMSIVIGCQVQSLLQSSISNLSSIRALRISYNQLEATLPSDIGINLLICKLLALVLTNLLALFLLQCNKSGIPLKQRQQTYWINLQQYWKWKNWWFEPFVVFAQRYLLGGLGSKW